MNKFKKHLKAIGICCLALASCFMLSGCNNVPINLEQEQVDALVETVNSTDEKLQELIEAVENNQVNLEELYQILNGNATATDGKLAELIEAIENNKLNLNELYEILNAQNNKLTAQDAYKMALNAELKLANNIGEEACAYKVEHKVKRAGETKIGIEYFVKNQDASKTYVGTQGGFDSGTTAVYYNAEQYKYVSYDSWGEEVRTHNYYLSAMQFAYMSKYNLKVKNFNVDNVVNVEVLANGNIKVTFYKYDTTSEIYEQYDGTEYTVKTSTEQTFVVELNANGLIVATEQYVNEVETSPTYSTPHCSEENLSSTYTYGLNAQDLAAIDAAIAEAEAVYAENN